MFTRLVDTINAAGGVVKTIERNQKAKEIAVNTNPNEVIAQLISEHFLTYNRGEFIDFDNQEFKSELNQIIHAIFDPLLKYSPSGSLAGQDYAESFVKYFDYASFGTPLKNIKGAITQLVDIHGLRGYLPPPNHDPAQIIELLSQRVKQHMVKYAFSEIQNIKVKYSIRYLAEGNSDVGQTKPEREVRHETDLGIFLMVRQAWRAAP